jgi:serine/threonine-protein kinase
LILAFAYSATQPECGKLRWALDYFLRDRRTPDTMNEALVTALAPLAVIAAVCQILKQQSMEESHWVVLDQRLRSLEQQVIYANPQATEWILGGLAERCASTSGPSA